MASEWSVWALMAQSPCLTLDTSGLASSRGPYGIGSGLSSFQTCFPHSHVWFPRPLPRKLAPHKPPSQSPSPETLTRGTSQHSLCPTLTYTAFLGATKAPFLSSAKAPTTWGEVMHLCPSPTKWKPLEKDHIYSTLTVQHFIWCLQQPPDT